MESISAKKMTPVRDPVRFMDGGNITYNDLKNALQSRIDEYGVPVAMDSGEISYGIFSPSVECLTLYHPEHHNDYYDFCLIIKPLGKTCTIEAYSYGKSTQMSREAFAENTKVFDGSGVGNTALGLLSGGAIGAGFAIGSAVTGIAKAGGKAIAKGINALMRDPAALEQEKAWYDAIFSVFNDVIS